MEKDLMIKEKTLMLKSYEKLLNGEVKSGESLFKIQATQLEQENKYLKAEIGNLKKNQEKKRLENNENSTLSLVLEEIKKLNRKEVSVEDLSDLQNKFEALQYSMEEKKEL